MWPRSPARLALPAVLALLGAGGGCAAIDDAWKWDSPAASLAPALPAHGGAMPPPFPAYGAGVPAPGAMGAGDGPGSAGVLTPDPYCRRAWQEARAAAREAELAARDAQLGAHAGAPGWAQAQVARRAEAAAAEARRARFYAERDC